MTAFFGNAIPSVTVSLLVPIALIFGANGALGTQISLAIRTVAPGATIVLPADFVSQMVLAPGLQFDVQNDNPALPLASTMGSSTTKLGKGPYSIDLPPNRNRFLIMSLNKNGTGMNRVAVKLVVELGDD